VPLAQGSFGYNNDASYIYPKEIPKWPIKILNITTHQGDARIKKQ
jgi:hypothetical protein